jgi:serine/threonine-protein kinase
MQQQHHRRVEPEEQDRRRRGLVITGVVFAVIIVFAVAALATTFLLSGSKVDVPTVTGQPQAIALATMKARGFTCVIAPQKTPSPTIAVNSVVTQDPAGNTKASTSDPCTLTLSSGPAAVTVQNFTGRLLTDAQAWGKQNNITVTVTPDTSSSQPAGTVTDQDPKDGTLPAGGEIKVKVAGGQVQVPPVVGQSLQDAQSALTNAGFKPRVQNYKNTTDQSKDNTVASQSPDGNSNAAKNSTVNLIVYRYKPANPSPSTSASSGTLVGGNTTSSAPPTTTNGGGTGTNTN